MFARPRSAPRHARGERGPQRRESACVCHSGGCTVRHRAQAVPQGCDARTDSTARTQSERQRGCKFRPEVPRRSRSWRPAKRPARSRRRRETRNSAHTRDSREPLVTAARAARRRAPSWRERGSKKQLGQRVGSVASVGTSVLGEQPKHEHHLARYRGDIGKI